MPYILRFVQSYRPENREKFMEIEAKFVQMERRRPEYPKGRRLQPFTGRLATNTIICEFTFDRLEDAEGALSMITADREHDSLLEKQLPYMKDSYTEIYEVLDF